MDTYYGIVRLLPRVQRRLSEKERQSIKSGSVFVWDEREAGMRRWTDGKSWSASRVSGSFLTYREMEGKRGGGQFVPPPVSRMAGKTPDSGKGSDDDQDMDGDGPDGYRYKPDGLMKQSFSITTSTGQHLHLISYFSRPHPNAPELMQPTNDPQLRGIVPVKGMYPESTVHEAQGPAVTRAPMNQSPYMHPSQRVPYGYSVPQGGYAWPPSPVSTPPYQHHPHIFSSHLPPPPGSMHVSPYQSQPGPAQHQSPYPQPQYSPRNRNMHIPTTMAQGPPSIYDRPPPPPSNSSLPPPPPHMMNGGPQQAHPPYQSNPSPRLEQARVVAEQQAQMAQRALQNNLIDPRITGQLPPVPPVAPVNGTQTNGVPRTATPPRQTSASPHHTPKSNQQPTSPAKDQGSPTTNGNGPATSQAQTIPSISSLVHASDSVSVMADNKSNSSNNSRAGSSSPKEKRADDDQKATDIPHEKLNIGGEDQRAIRVLDRKFMI
ncbi:Gluconate transport-inducing protein [Clarireedia jacksonii]